MSGSYDSRCSALEESLGMNAVVCACAGHPLSLLLLSWFSEPTQEELAEFERHRRWSCPIHGSCSPASVMTLSPSGGIAAARAAAVRALPATETNVGEVLGAADPPTNQPTSPGGFDGYYC